MKRLLIIMFVCLANAWAQPYLAAGGFGRPQGLDRTNTGTDVALASDGGAVYAFWAGDEGIVREALSGPNEGESELVVENRHIRSVMAVSVHGSVALAWVDRSNRTGRSRHVIRWRGETRTVLEAAAPRPFALAAGPDGPVALVVVHPAREDELTLVAWNGESTEIARSQFSMEQPAIAYGQGGFHIAWLEGLRQVQASGLVQVGWHAKYRRLDEAGQLGPIVTLGPAAEPRLTSPVVVSVTVDGPQVMWNYEDRAERKAGLALAVPGETVRLIAVQGYAIGLYGGDAYWAQGDGIRRRAIGPGATEEQVAAASVLWSPVPVERASALATQGELFMLWYGPTAGITGADFAVYSADTRVPFVPGWRDRIAAHLDWNPWNFWIALGGQVLGSLFISVLAAMVALPVFWLLGLLFRGRGSGQGVLLGVGLVAVLCLIMYLRSGTLPAGPVELAASLLAAAVIAYLLTRRANAELQMQALLGALVTTFVAVSLLGFLNLQRWVSLWSGLSG